MTVELQNIVPQLASAQVSISVNVTATLNITAYTAKRQVSVLVLHRVGTGLFGDEPSLVVTGKSVVWRVPIFVSTASRGRLGQVGQVDVDAQTGEIMADDTLLKAIGDNAERLVAGTAL
jgi:NAD-dependent oxidoreductase involved in siderophore biosynthesis